LGQLDSEIVANYTSFDSSSFASLSAVRGSLSRESPRYLASYRRVATLQAWRTVLLQEILPPDALAFFLEAQNDALMSHVMARMGVWRLALQALRSCIENAVLTLYYMDHPVELTLWKEAQFRIGFSEVHTYLKSHPALRKLGEAISGIHTISVEYATLSRAVHASGSSFRMAQNGRPELWNDERTKLGQWHTRERHVVASLNLLLLAVFRSHLQGTRKPALRIVIGSVLSAAKRAAVKTALGVSVG
jgi:hypothetical protein